MPENKRKQQSFEYGSIILLCSTMLVKVIGAVFKIPLEWLLGTLGFGYFSSAYDLFIPIYSLAMAGLPIAVSRIVAENMTNKKFRDVHKTLSVTRRLFFISGLVGFVVMLLLIYPFVKMTDRTGQTVYSLFAIAPALFFCCIMSTYRGYYEGLRNMYPTAISNVIEALGKLIFGYSFAFVVLKLTDNVALGAAGAMLGITVGAFFSAAYLRIYHKIKGDGITAAELEESPAPKSTNVTVKIIISVAIPIALASLANSIASLVDVSMVKWQLSNLMDSYAETIRSMYEISIADYNSSAEKPLLDNAIPTFLYGVRGMAFTVYNLVPTITSVLGVSALPVITSSWTAGDKPLLKRNIESSIKFTALIAMPAGVGFFALGGQIMDLLYGTVAAVEIGAPLMRIYGVAALFAGLAIPMTSMLQAIGKQKIALRNIAIGAVLKVVVNFVCVSIPSFNIKGAAVGTFACYLFIFLSHFISLVKFTGVIPDIKKVYLKPFFSAVFCGVAAYAVSLLGNSSIITVISIVAAAIVYFVALIALNSFEEEDLLSLPKGKKLLDKAKKYKIIR